MSRKLLLVMVLLMIVTAVPVSGSEQFLFKSQSTDSSKNLVKDAKATQDSTRSAENILSPLLEFGGEGDGLFENIKPGLFYGHKWNYKFNSKGNIWNKTLIGFTMHSRPVVEDTTKLTDALILPGTFNFMISGFAQIVKKATTFGKAGIKPQLRCNNR